YQRLGSFPYKKSFDAIQFSPDGKYLACVVDNSCKLMNLSNNSEATTFAWNSGRMEYVAFAPDGKTLAIGGSFERRNSASRILETRIVFWNLATQREMAAVSTV